MHSPERATIAMILRALFIALCIGIWGVAGAVLVSIAAVLATAALAAEPASIADRLWSSETAWQILWWTILLFGSTFAGLVVALVGRAYQALGLTLTERNAAIIGQVLEKAVAYAQSRARGAEAISLAADYALARAPVALGREKIRTVDDPHLAMMIAARLSPEVRDDTAARAFGPSNT